MLANNTQINSQRFYIRNVSTSRLFTSPNKYHDYDVQMLVVIVIGHGLRDTRDGFVHGRTLSYLDSRFDACTLVQVAGGQDPVRPRREMVGDVRNVDPR